MQADGQNATPGTHLAARTGGPTPDSVSQLSTINPQPPQIPDHDLLRLIGRGSYGEVWLARNAIGTLRAVKIVHRQSFQRAEHFEREFKGLLRFEPVSRSHDGLVDILQIGRRDDAGYFFYVMELADDGSKRSNGVAESWSDAQTPAVQYSGTPALQHSNSYTPLTLRSELQSRGSLPPAECIAIDLKLAAALEHLHGNGLVHRDIKPSNIIFVNGEPKLADIGLVTAIDEAHSLVGTVGYIPPEGPGTPQADLYSFGKVLYEVAFGKDRQDFPQLPPDLQSHPDYAALLELNEVILKACETDPRRRYASAAALRGDLALLARGNSVLGAHQVERRWRLVRRVAGWVTVAAVALTVIAIVSRVRQPAAAPLVERRGTNDVANRFYDLGRYYYEKSTGKDFQTAATYFERAIEADSRFAQAYSSLALTYTRTIIGEWNTNWNLLPKAKELALMALQLDHSLAEPHLTLGWHKALAEWAWGDAEREYLRAIELKPSAYMCHCLFGEFLRVTGRTNEALNEMARAYSLDTRSVHVTARLGESMMACRRFKEALTQANQALAMDTNSAPAHRLRINALCALGKFPEAIQAERANRLLSGEPNGDLQLELAELQGAYEAEGPKAYWRRELERRRASSSPFWQACAHAQLGETNRAITCLQTAVTNRDVWLTFNVMTDWRLDPVRSDPQFDNILKAMHLK